MMKLILSQYIRSLKERNEFDSLLPELLLSMGYSPIAKPQTGVRQYGVDFAAVGPNFEDGVQELLLFVIKCGDISRSVWNSGPQAIRQSLDEVADVYLQTHLEPVHAKLRKKIVVTTSGDMKQDTQINWDGYVKSHPENSYEFWGADRVAILLEKYMLNEHLLDRENRIYLRKSLALAGDRDYDRQHLHLLILKLLGLNEKGEALTTKTKAKALAKSLKTLHLATQIYSKWAEDEGNLKQGLLAFERSLLWAWHRVQLEDPQNQSQYGEEIGALWGGYLNVCVRYFNKLHKHFYTKDGLSGYTHVNAEFALIVFEQIGLLATFGLNQILVSHVDQSHQDRNNQAVEAIVNALISLIKNNPVSGSPRLDNHAIDIILALFLFKATGHTEFAAEWLAELVRRMDYTLRIKRNFPIGTDSLDDLVEVSFSNNEELKERLMQMSWLLATYADWAVILEQEEVFSVIANNIGKDYPHVCPQLWHATAETMHFLYFKTAHYSSGESEAPIKIHSFEKHRKRIESIANSERHNILSHSSAAAVGLLPIDLIACRHFRTLVAPYIWYQLMSISKPELSLSA